MSPKKQKCAQQIQRDERGRLILNRGPFAKKLILTEEQASELQPIFDEMIIWVKRLRRWMLPFFCMMNVMAVVAVGLVSMQYLLLAIVGIGAFGLIGIQFSWMNQPWYQAYVDLHKHLHKNAPRV